MHGRAGSPGSRMDFLVCPPESLLEIFVRRPFGLEPGLVRAVSRHLARCALCREEADSLRRGMEASDIRRPWLWALAALVPLALLSGLFMIHELHGRGAGTSHDGNLRPDARVAALARFEPPVEAGLWGPSGSPDAEGPGASAIPPMTAEDRRQLAAARDMLEADRPRDAAGLLEDLTRRHPGRGALRLLLAYALARGGEFDRAARHYRAADEHGMGAQACWGVVNSCLRMGDIPCARRELAEHLLARRPDDEDALDLLTRLSSSRGRAPR